MKDILVTGPDGKEILIKPLGRFTCPFCKHTKHFVIGYMHGDEETGVPVVMHDVPHCDVFLAKGVLEYMRAARISGARPVSESSELN